MNVEGILNRDGDVMSGEVVFKGTRVPAETLFNYPAGSLPLRAFAHDFSIFGTAQARSTLVPAADLLKADFF